MGWPSLGSFSDWHALATGYRYSFFFFSSFLLTDSSFTSSLFDGVHG